MEELSLHLLDIAENSLRAGAGEVEITIKDFPRQNYLLIRVRDNGRGMENREIENLLDPFYTTRTERNVGLGIPLLKMTADNCRGSLMISSIVGRGTNLEVTLEHNNIDRPPLGNMVSTLITILVGWPKVHLKYQHSYLPEKGNFLDGFGDSKSFIFDTEEVKEKLDGLPINNIQVISFLREYLRTMLIKLYGGENNEIFG